MLGRLRLSRLAANGPLLGERRICMFAKSGDGTTPPPQPGASGEPPAPEGTDRTERGEAPKNNAGVNDEATRRLREEGHARMRSLLGEEDAIPPEALPPPATKVHIPLPMIDEAGAPPPTAGGAGAGGPPRVPPAPPSSGEPPEPPERPNRGGEEPEDAETRERREAMSSEVLWVIRQMTLETRIQLRDLLAPSIISGEPSNAPGGLVRDILNLGRWRSRFVFGTLERHIREERREEARGRNAGGGPGTPPGSPPGTPPGSPPTTSPTAVPPTSPATAEPSSGAHDAERKKREAKEKEEADRKRREADEERAYNLRETKDRVLRAQAEISKNIERLKKLESIIVERIKKPEEQKEHLHVLHSNLKFLEDGLGTMTSWTRLMETMNAWEGGNMSPVRFVTELQTYIRPEATDAEKEQFLVEGLETLCKDHPEIGKEERRDHKFDYGTNWDTLSASHKISIAKGASGGVKKFINEYLEGVEDQFPTLHKYSESVEALANPKGGEFQLGIGFYSINEIVASVKNVVEAFKTAGKEWTQLRVAGLSAQLGNLTKHLPFGDSAQQTLSASLNHKDDEVKDHYTKHLESDIVPFYEMIPSHHGAGYLERNKNDGNRFRGSLDYMAKKGWIYDIDIANKTVMGHKLVAGKTVPATWTDVNITEYLIHLDGANKSGQSAEKKRGYDRVDRVASIAPGIEILKHEIADGNYWAVLGILNRLLEKAKNGHTATWIATSIMGMLRRDERARRYFPIELLDRLGNEGLVHLANTNINFVIDRWKIRAWGDKTWEKNKLAEEKLKEAGGLANIILAIEDEIKTRQHEKGLPDLSADKMEETVAKVLASQAVKLDGWDRALSIFASRFDEYRRMFKVGGQGKTIDPSKTDDDFFNEDSEMVMHGSHIANRILDVRSPSNLQYAEKGIAFMAQLLRRNRQLGDAGLADDQRTFQRETQKMFEGVLLDTWNGDVSQNFHLKFRHKEARGKFLLQALVDDNLIDKAFISTLNTKLGENLRAQLGIPDRTEKIKSTPSTATPPSGSSAGSSTPTIAI